jgi:hypothetical protein
MRIRPTGTSNSVRVHLLLVKILIVLIFATIALGLVVSVKIHSLELPLGTDHPVTVTLSSSRSHHWQQQQQPPPIAPSKNDGISTGAIPSFVLQDPERQPILKILREAGYDFNDTKIFTPETLDSLPKWSEVLELYGEPKILGLETCQAFREKVDDPTLRELGVAGLFSSGTNTLYNSKFLWRDSRKYKKVSVPISH